MVIPVYNEKESLAALLAEFDDVAHEILPIGHADICVIWRISIDT